jgi:ribulose-5-phosphate 4-epimerase/fuculose-1-phosphate aldolase
MLFAEVTASSLLRVSLEGEILEGEEFQYNKTGYVIHGNIYKQRADINAIFHLHTTAGIAISAMKDGLLPISQFALHLHNQISYYDYNSLELDTNNDSLTDALGQNKVMILRNHGTITCGSTMHEAFFYTYHLEQACKVQCKTLAAGRGNLVLLNEEICQKSNRELLNFEQDIGYRDWQALIRNLNKKDISYKQ